MSWWARPADRVKILVELIGSLWERKLWWMTPMVVALVGFGALLILAQSSVIAPFIYTPF